MTIPKVYVRDHSVSLPGSAAGDGAVLRWCASYDSGGVGTTTAYWQVFQVDSFDSNGWPQAGAQVLALASGQASIPNARLGPFNREEVGYGWPEQQTVIPNISPDNAEVDAGLCCVMVSATGDWDAANAQYALFLVRRRTASTKAVVCYPFATLLAYSGGVQNQHNTIYESFAWGRTRRVSLDRPFKNTPFPPGNSEIPTIQYAQAMQRFIAGYKGKATVDVCTSFDLHSDTNVLTGAVLLVSVGHDEYWSKEMRDRVQAFVLAGNNVAFFSANTAWWQVRFEGNGRTMVCCKSAIEDPSVATDTKTGNFGSVPTSGLGGTGGYAHGEENTLTGVSYRRGIQSGPDLGYVVQLPQHAYLTTPNATGLVQGAMFGIGLTSVETDAADTVIQNGVHTVTGADLRDPLVCLLHSTHSSFHAA